MLSLLFTDGSGLGGFGVLGLGFVLGLRHALDADHLVAVAAIVSERKGLLSSSIVGALWGVGHTAALLIVGLGGLILRVQIPESVASWLERGVAVMIVLLGMNVLRGVKRVDRIHMHVHEHNGYLHAHPHKHSHKEHAAGHPLPHHHHALTNVLQHVARGKRSVFIGMVHGMAGSAGLMLIVMASISSTITGLAYIAVFGIGSILGMLVMSTLIGVPFAASVRRSEKANLMMRGITGAASVLFGLFLAWEVGGW